MYDMYIFSSMPEVPLCPEDCHQKYIFQREREREREDFEWEYNNGAALKDALCATLEMSDI